MLLISSIRMGNDRHVLFAFLALGSLAASSPALAKEGQPCGCSSMKIISKGNSDIYCANTKDLKKLPPFTKAVVNPPNNPCTAQQTPFTFDLGLQKSTNSYRGYQWGFAVVATVSGNPNVCTEGQYVRGDRTDNGKPVENPEAANVPEKGELSLPPNQKINGVANTANTHIRDPKLSDANYGADGFTEPTNANHNWAKRHEPQKIVWFDAPSRPVRHGTQKSSLEGEFVSFVKGKPDDAKSCWCKFKLKMDWTAAGNATGSIDKIDGKDCDVEKP